MIMRNPVIVKDFFPGHVIVDSTKTSIGEFHSVVWGSLKPQVPLQKSNLETFPTNDLDGFFTKSTSSNSSCDAEVIDRM